LFCSQKKGAQQGDPLGPLYFCLVLQPILKSLLSELVVRYLDDVCSLGSDAETVLNDFRYMETAAKQLGLEMNYSKCEVVGHNDVSRALFVSHGISSWRMAHSVRGTLNDINAMIQSVVRNIAG
jgi:Reverse transcriptase (RNA-dependent DNA polymerase)